MTAAPRRWRPLDLCGLPVELEYAIWRVDFPGCGVTTESVPWADAGSGFTSPFEDLVAHLAQQCGKTTVTRLMRVAWATVGASSSASSGDWGQSIGSRV